MEKVSIILPVYNVEKYLSKCMDTIINQTYKNIEIIAVNDGATDTSRSILEKYKNIDERVMIVDKENGGLMSAWIAGLKKASADWICFVDSDDWVEIDMVEKFMLVASGNTNIDLVIGSYQEEYDDGHKNKQLNIVKDGYYSLDDMNHDEKIKFLGKMISYNSGFRDRGFIVTRWGKLIRKQLLLECIKYCNPNISYGEDINIIYPILFRARNIIISNELCIYHYRLNMESILHSYTKNMKQQIDQLYNILFNCIDEMELDELSKYLKMDYASMILCTVKNETKNNNRNIMNAKKILNSMFDNRWKQTLSEIDNKHFGKFNKVLLVILKHQWTIFLALYLDLLRLKEK